MFNIIINRMEVVAFGMLSYLFLDDTNLTGGMRKPRRVRLGPRRGDLDPKLNLRGPRASRRAARYYLNRGLRQARQLRRDIAAKPNPFPPQTLDQLIHYNETMPNPYPKPRAPPAPTISAADLLPATNTTVVATPPTSRVATSARERPSVEDFPARMRNNPVLRRQESDEFARRLMGSMGRTASADQLERWVTDQENLEFSTGYNTTLAQARRRVAAAGAMPEGLTQRIAARLDTD